MTFRLIPMLLAVALVGCDAPNSEPVVPVDDTAPADENMEKPVGDAIDEKDVSVTPASFNLQDAPVVEYKAPEMHCVVCAASIVKAMKEKPGVVDVKADPETKIVSVAIDKSKFESNSAIDAVAEAGFGEATPLEDKLPVADAS